MIFFGEVPDVVRGQLLAVRTFLLGASAALRSLLVDVPVLADVSIVGQKCIGDLAAFPVPAKLLINSWKTGIVRIPGDDVSDKPAACTALINLRLFCGNVADQLIAVVPVLLPFQTDLILGQNRRPLITAVLIGAVFQEAVDLGRCKTFGDVADTVDLNPVSAASVRADPQNPVDNAVPCFSHGIADGHDGC